MWLNYLIWCSKHKFTLPGNPLNFEWPEIRALISNYDGYFTFMIHDTNPADSVVCLGSHQAWYNFFLNLNTKKDKADKYILYNSALKAVKHQKNNFQFNLDWRMIWIDPEQFIKNLNSIWPFDVAYNEHTQRAFEQYRASCILPNIDSQEFQQSDLFQRWHQALVDHETDVNLSLEDRDKQALDITRNMYFDGCKN
jgi:hypothetical protein